MTISDTRVAASSPISSRVKIGADEDDNTVPRPENKETLPEDRLSPGKRKKRTRGLSLTTTGVGDDDDGNGGGNRGSGK